MKSHFTDIITALFFVLGVSSCTHITMLGHTSAYDINAEFSGDPIAPVSLNAGFEGRSAAAVPPRRAVYWWDNFNPDKLPEGDVMSSILELKIQKVVSEGSGSNVPFDYVTSGATGLAADAAAGASPTGNLVENTDGEGAALNTTNSNVISEKIKNITNVGL